MQNNNRNVQYDWFKGGNNEKKQRKNTFKNAWKWAKIFIYLSLFTFSMFGCVQIFAIQTSTTVGQGIELYNSEDDISPSTGVTNFTKGYTYSVDKTDPDFPEAIPVSDPTLASQELKLTYAATQSATSNTWVNKHQDKDLLSNMHSFVKDSQKTKMVNAYKGLNQSYKVNLSNNKDFSYLPDPKSPKSSVNSPVEFSAKSLEEDVPNGKDINESKAVYIDADKPLVFSSAAKSYDISNTINKNKVQSFWVPTLDKWEEVKYSQGTPNEKAYYKPVYSAIEVKLNADQKDVQGNLLVNENRNNAMAIDLINYYRGLENNAFGFAFDTKQEAVDYLNETLYFLKTDDPQGVKAGYINDVSYRNPRFDHLWQSGTGIAQPLLVNLGIKNKVEDTGTTYNDVVFKKIIELNQYRFPSPASTSTNWRPVTSWGDAWSLGPFYGIFVYPISAVTNAILGSMGMFAGWETVGTIIIVVFTIRIITFALSFKGSMQQQKMQNLNSKKAMIEAKYAAYKDNRQMEMRKRQEIQDMYKKENINPMASIGTVFLTMPFFLAIWRVIGGIPHIKAASWLGIVFSETSWRALFAGAVQYLPLIVIAIGIQALSQYYPKWLNRKQDRIRMNSQQKAALKKSNKTQNIMSYVMIFMAAVFSAGIQIYWIIGGVWRIIESYITNRLRKIIKKREQKSFIKK